MNSFHHSIYWLLYRAFVAAGAAYDSLNLSHLHYITHVGPSLKPNDASAHVTSVWTAAVTNYIVLAGGFRVNIFCSCTEWYPSNGSIGSSAFGFTYCAYDIIQKRKQRPMTRNLKKCTVTITVKMIANAWFFLLSLSIWYSYAIFSDTLKDRALISLDVALSPPSISVSSDFMVLCKCFFFKFYLLHFTL